MSPATEPRPVSALRVLVVEDETLRSVRAAEIVDLFEAGDVVVVNDAATLPASLRALGGVEARLLTYLSESRWLAALLGEGDWRTRTEDRPAPPRLEVGAELVFDAGLRAVVEELRPESPRLVILRFFVSGGPGEVWEAMYRAGHPVQYAHVPEPLALWDVQNVYAGRPWSVEMPSAGRAFRAETILALRARGVDVVAVTHAAGLSHVGDPAIDAMLPMPERYEISNTTWDAVQRARRVIAVGTSVVRALESAARTGHLSGVTDLLVGPGTKLQIVGAVLTGVHEAETSHYRLLSAFSSKAFLARAFDAALTAGLLGHEFGDALLVIRSRLAPSSS